MVRKRVRDYGLTVGELPTGKWNSLTDVPGVAVGHVTLRDGKTDETAVCTGVTAILPHSGNLFREKVAAAACVINGFGKTTGLVQVNELGLIESPLMLTNTFSVPPVTEGVLMHMMLKDKGIGADAGSLNVVVGECNDSRLNDMRGLHVRPEHAVQAIKAAQADVAVVEGAVGAGTGMVCFGWKGGIGSASRQIQIGQIAHHIGVLVLSNFGAREDLTILGYPVGRRLSGADTPGVQRNSPSDDGHINRDGSVIIVIGTDIPLDARQLKRLCKRAAFGLARTGSIAHHGSGDIAIAFSNANRIPHEPDAHFVGIPVLREDGPLISQCFRAVVEATEEAVLNSLFMAETTVGKQGNEVQALPVEEFISFASSAEVSSEQAQGPVATVLPKKPFLSSLS